MRAFLVSRTWRWGRWIFWHERQTVSHWRREAAMTTALCTKTKLTRLFTLAHAVVWSDELWYLALYGWRVDMALHGIVAGDYVVAR